MGEFGWVVILLSYYVTADTHFNHANIIRYCGRPFSSAEEMNAAMIENWNSVIKPDDIVLHLGDVGFGQVGLSCIQQCNGRKILIRGNHDRSFSNRALSLAGFEAVYKKYDGPFVYYTPGGPVLEKHSVILSHAPKAEIVDADLPCLCGHVHERWDFCYGWLNVGVDVWEFKPILLSLAISTWNKAKQLGVTNGI